MTRGPEAAGARPGERARQPREDPVRSGTLVADAQAIVRYGVVHLLRDEGFEICGQAADADSALRLAGLHDPDLVILDPCMDGHGAAAGLQLISGLRTAAPEAPILVFSTLEETLYAERALRAGASGYLMKAATTTQFLEAVDEVRNGKLHVSGRVRSGLLRRVASGGGQPREHPLAMLTDREIEVFRLLGEGCSTREVAERLALSVKTIETHRAKIMRKLGLRNASQLLHRAIAWVHFGSPDPGRDVG
jgi:DNA-binding NarL/FixJ family response regulator